VLRWGQASPLLEMLQLIIPQPESAKHKTSAAQLRRAVR
jgi:hypothetical protein